MPTLTPAQVVTTHAIVGNHQDVHAWFAAKHLELDMLYTAETAETVDGVRHIDRYVAFADNRISAEQAARHDHVVQV